MISLEEIKRQEAVKNKGYMTEQGFWLDSDNKAWLNGLPYKTELLNGVRVPYMDPNGTKYYMDVLGQPSDKAVFYTQKNNTGSGVADITKKYFILIYPTAHSGFNFLPVPSAVPTNLWRPKTQAEIDTDNAKSKAANQSKFNIAFRSLAHQVTHPVETLKNMANNLKGTLLKGAEWALMMPFMPTMITSLKLRKANIKKPGDPEYVTRLFYEGIVKPRIDSMHHLENLSDDQNADIDQMANNPLPNDPKDQQSEQVMKTGDVMADTAGKSGNPYGMAASTFLKMILSFIRGMQKNKRKEKLTKEEQEAGAKVAVASDSAIANQADKDTDALANMAAGDGQTLTNSNNAPVTKPSAVKPERKSPFMERLFPKYYDSRHYASDEMTAYLAAKMNDADPAKNEEKLTAGFKKAHLTIAEYDRFDKITDNKSEGTWSKPDMDFVKQILARAGF